MFSRSLGGVTDHRIVNGLVELECGDAAVRIGPERSGIIRVRLAPTGVFGRDHSWAVIESAAPAIPMRIEENSQELTVVAGELRVCVRRDPCRISFVTTQPDRLASDTPGKGMSWAGAEVRCYKQLREGDHVFGLGERGGALDKLGGVWVNWNHDAAAHEPWTDPLYQSHPFFLILNSGAAYGFFFDNAHRASFDMGKLGTDCYSFGADGGELDYYFIPGPGPKDVVRRYGELVGTTPLPPRWALGYQQCRFGYSSARRVRQIARRLRANRIPCDAIYLDIDYMDGFRCFTWDPKRFANPDRLIKDLDKLDYKAVCIIDSGIKKEPGYCVYDEGLAGDHFCGDGRGAAYVGKAWPGETVFPDFTRAATRQWWGDLHRGLVDSGVAGIWNDMNEPADFTFAHGTVPWNVRHDNDGEPADHRSSHNVYGMQMSRATFEGLGRIRPDERPFVLTRAGYAGVQRYAAVWTGDNRSSWEHLRMSIPMLLNMSLSGMGFCGADVGGFRGTALPELYTRWLQLGVFYPLYRTHTGGGPEQDPTAFGGAPLRLNRRAIELRYRLLPYIYSQMKEGEESGLPLLRPVFLEFPYHPDVHKCDDVFMFGDQLLVAPVVHEGAKTRRLSLPAGEWYAFESGERYECGRKYEIPVGPASIPIFARAGAAVPMQRVRQFVGQAPVTELTVRVFPGDGGGRFYNDDGVSYAYRQGAFSLEQYGVARSAKSLAVRLIERTGCGEFAPRSYSVRFVGISHAPARVLYDGMRIRRFASTRELHRADRGWRFDRRGRAVCIRSGGWRAGAAFELQFRA